MSLKKKKIIQIFSNGVLYFSNNQSLSTLTKYKYYEKTFKDLQFYNTSEESNNMYFKTQAISSVQKYRKFFFK